MTRPTVGLVVLTACMALTVVVRASDMVGVYGVIEKVILEPSDKAPDRIQIWGAFALAEGNSGSTYGPAQRGYLYYSCMSGQESMCRNEWADLKSVVGKTTAIGFGFRYRPNGRVRKVDERPASPDQYPIERGVVKVENASDRGSETMKVIDGLRAALKQH